LACALLVAPPFLPAALANPKGLVEIEGHVEIEQDGSHTEITTFEESTRAGFRAGFDIERDESVWVQQPTVGSKFFAEDWSGNQTDIDGSLGSNGLVGVINPFGVFIGNEALVDVAGLVAAGGHLDEAALAAGDFAFSGLTGAVEVARGARIEADDSVLLVGRSVANYGHISAPGGTVVLAAGDALTLAHVNGRVVVRGDTMANDPGDFAVRQEGSIDAAGGYVSLTAGDGYSLAMNHSGITRARDIEVDGGSSGLVQLAGSLDASDGTRGATGGSITVEGELLDVGGSLDASGDAGGGVIRVGGDIRGQGALANARRTHVGEGSLLRADALREGDGGSVVVYATERTSFKGEISARGAGQGGDGGFAEISGAALEFAGQVGLGSEQGRNGTLLFDPVDIRIDGDGVGSSGEPLDNKNRVLFGDDPSAGEPFVITESTLQDADAIDGDIVLEATNSIVTSATSTFGNGDVQLAQGMSITMRTRNNPDDADGSAIPAGIDIDGGDGALEWRTSSTPGDGELEPASIVLETGSGNSSGDAPISFGRLFAEGGTVTLTTDAGSITGERIEALGLFGFDGDDADDSVLIEVETGDVGITEIVADIRSDDIDEIGVSGPVRILIGESGNVSVGRIHTEGGPRNVDDGTVRGVAIDVAAGDITVGEIVTSGPDGEDADAARLDPMDPDSEFVRATRRAGFAGDVLVTTSNGNVSVGSIEARGGDAFAQDASEVPQVPDPENPGAEIDDPDFIDPASRVNGDGGNGGQISVTALGDGLDSAAGGTGHVDVGTGGFVDASGGTGSVAEIDADGFDDSDGADLLAGRGGDGGNVQISGSGSVLVDGPIRASGGDSNATIDLNVDVEDDPDQLLVSDNTNFFVGQLIATGGNGGTVSVDGGGQDDPDTGEVEPSNPVQLFGDVTSNGGNGTGRLEVEDPVDISETVTLGVAGGVGGSLQVGGVGEVKVGQTNDPVLIQASGGDSEYGNGGSAERSFESIVVGRSASSELGGLSSGDLEVYGQLVANGGKGEDGGAGGIVVVRASSADVLHGNATSNDVPSVDPQGNDEHARLGLDELEGILVADGGDSDHLGESFVVELVPGSEEYVFEDRAGDGGNIEVVGNLSTVMQAARARGGDSMQGLGGSGGNIVITGLSGNLVNNGLLDVSGGDGATEPGLLFQLEIQLDPDRYLDLEPELQPTPYVPEVHEIAGGGNGGLINANAEQGTMDLLGGSVGSAGTGGGDSDDGIAGALRARGGGDIRIEQIGDIGSVSATQLERTANTTLVTAMGGTLDVMGSDTDAPFVQTVVDFHTPDGDTALAYTLQVPADETPVSEGGRDESEAPVIDIVLGASTGRVGRVGTGDETHAIVNRNGDMLGDPLAATHLELSGAVALEAENIGETGNRIVVDGAGGELQLVAGGDNDGADGDIYVEAIDANGGLAGIAVEQHEYTGITDILLPGAERILVAPVGGEMVVSELDTASYGASFAYALRDTSALDQPEGDLTVTPTGGALGGDLHLDVQGAIRLGAGAIQANDHRVGLIAEGPIAAVSGAGGEVTIDDPSGLLLFAGPGAGSQPDSDIALVVSSDDAVAVNASANADFSLEVRGAPGTTGDIVITEVEPDIGNVRELVGGVSAVGDVLLRTAADSDIVLGASLADGPIGVSSGGSQTFAAERVLIENVRLVAEAVEGVGGDGKPRINGIPVPVNEAAIIAGKDVIFEGSIHTSPEALDTGSNTIYASFDIAALGTTSFGGDVGTPTFDDTGTVIPLPLARLEVLDTDIGSADPLDTRTFVVGEGIFDGRIDGEGTAVFSTDPAAALSPEDESLLFGKNIGGRSDLRGFQADAPLVTFTTTDSVKTGAGGIRINVDEDLGGVVPTRATIGDRNGHLTLDSEGDIVVGELHKLTTVGTLRLESDTRVTVGDLNANKIVIESPVIEMRQRDAGEVEVEGQTPEMDQGVDWVANQINTNSAIRLVGTPDPMLPNAPRLVIGTGGIRSPSNFDQFEVVRLNDSLDAVTSGILLASDGETLLDLTGDGPPVLGDPSRELNRKHAQPSPPLDARSDGAAPAAPPSASANEVLAMLRCTGEECLPDVRRGPLSTPRAAEIARVYRERVSSRDGRVRLRATFAVAARAYRERGARGLDGSDFYAFLAASDLFEDARSEIDSLAGLLVQVDLLGLSPEDTRAVQLEIATSFAAATSLRGFDVAAVLDAVDASPIGLVEP
jgi:filamentous hemagglutinin family protein